MQRPVGVTILGTFSLIWGILSVLVSPNRVFDASLVPETCLDRFVDLKGLIKQVSEERVWDYLGKQSSPGINFLGWGLGSYLSAAFLILMVICFALSAALGSGLLRLKNWARLTSIVLAAMSVLGAASQVPSAFSRLSPVLILFFAIRGAIDIWILIYFLRPEVEQTFGAARS